MHITKPLNSLPAVARVRSVEPVESVPQAHGRAVDSWHVLRCRSCMKDEGGPFEVGFQERASNHPKLRW